MGVEAAVGPHRERPTGAGMAHPSYRLAQEVSSTPSGVGPALPQPGQQHVAGAGGDGQQRVIAPLAGVAPVSSTGQAVAAGTLLGQAVVSQMVESRSMVKGASPGPAPAAQARTSSSRLTRSSWRTWPHRKLRRKAPRACPRESGGWMEP